MATLFAHPDSLTLQDERPIPQLPQEVVDYIISDYLFDDTTALRQCALVCKSWEPSSTLHLFASWSWPPCYHYYLTYKRTEDKVCRCGNNMFIALHDCFEFLSSSPRICTAIRHLHLATHATRRKRIERNSRELLLRILDLLPSLRTLSSRDFRDVYAKKDTIPSSAIGSRVVDELRYEERADSHSLGTASLLALFREIGKLVVRGAAHPLDPRDARARHLRTRIRAVSIEQAPGQGLGSILKVFERLLDQADLTALEDLEIYKCFLPHAPAFFNVATNVSTLKYEASNNHPAQIPNICPCVP